MSRLEIPEKFEGFLKPYRYKGAYGGRGSAKSWTISNILVNLAARQQELIVCGREFQNSIDDSVYRLLQKSIERYNLPYRFFKTSIECTTTGSEFIFKGLSKLDAASLKSLEGATKLWLEEAQNISHGSWENVIPTIRAENSEIWASWNPTVEDAPTHQRLVINPPPNSYIIKVNYSDNPWFPAVLDEERRHLRQTDPVAYDNVWEGNCRTFAEGAYFSQQMQDAAKFGRIGLVPHDPARQVWTFWDLGWDDSTAIWFIQPTDTGVFNVIDYWEGANTDLPTIAREVVIARANDLKYSYAKHVIPHDGGNGNRQTGKTDAEILESAGVRPVIVQERTRDKNGDVQNVRLVLPRCRFDAEHCKPGLAALRNYRQERDPKTGLWRFKHGWESHGTDAFRGFAVYQNDNTMQPANDNPRPHRRAAVPC
ncbi:PBSX family phage terminase large subunit [Mesorhizobium sp. B2-3-4]|uniref:PBSX family phage terminase large subunit n=1 Tax=Mesorhizobium sp. B2-3-4 TaxID=2589959 RepID=UPI0011296ACF|nr:PBSX family phage terminase large subunit [Mesorhizobium sp. B2-3-4]TPM41412.1 PBSX family phage terminase large subunit [Mesorhizobium sp. B2-3-4]